jgi:serine/threonine protein kinase
MKRSGKSQELESIGGYRLLEKLGQGGMGAVYRAHRPDREDEVVAVKVLAPSKNNAVILKRFEQEFRAALRLDHPNIVKVLGCGTEGEYHYLVMELVQGRSLGDLVAKGGALKEKLVIDVIVQIANALDRVHQLNLVHRDVKPDNILLADGGTAKLADLGLVKILDDDIDLTRPNSGLGTPNYMAPEQFDNAKYADLRFDIYSLGATLYTAVTGQVPFRASTPMHVLKKKFKCELTPVRDLVPKVSERIEQTIVRAMNIDPARRHANCQEFITDLLGKPAAPTRRSSARVRVIREPARSYSGRERRAHARHASRAESRCAPLASHQEDEWVATVHDISLSGIGLLVNRRFEIGTVLQVRVPDQYRGAPGRLLARVMRQQARSSRKWLIGCQFSSPLSQEELQSLL